MPTTITTFWKITYLTPLKNEKHVIWRGKSEDHAVRSWLVVAAPGTQCIETRPYKVKSFKA